jgi:MtN3 and saliva related transmembrane protein
VVTAIGLVAGLLTTACWLPQVVKTIRIGDADEFAWLYLAMLMIGLTGWAVYGSVRGDIPLALYNCITWVLVMIVVMIKVRGGAPKSKEAASTGAVD